MTSNGKAVACAIVPIVAPMIIFWNDCFLGSDILNEHVSGWSLKNVLSSFKDIGPCACLNYSLPKREYSFFLNDLCDILDTSWISLWVDREASTKYIKCAEMVYNSRCAPTITICNVVSGFLVMASILFLNSSLQKYQSALNGPWFNIATMFPRQKTVISSVSQS